MVDLVIEAAVSALMSAAATEVWQDARNRIARAVRPHDPEGESATLDRLVASRDAATQRQALQTHLFARLREHPEQLEDLHHGTGEVEQILIDADLVQVLAQNVHVHGPDRPSDAARLAVTQAARAAHELEVMSEDVATAHLAAMPSDVAAKRLALMANAATLISNMDERLAADLMVAMPPPKRALLFARIDPVQGAAIMAEMPVETAVAHLAELTETEPARAALLLFSMTRDLAAQLLAELSPPHPAELFSRMGPDRAGALLAAMNRDKAVWRISEMPVEHAALLLSKMDKLAAVDLLGRIVAPMCTELLAKMTPGEGAEVLAKMDPGWARDRLAQMPSSRALELLVALRPPRSLVKEIDGDLAARLLPAAVLALARRAEDMELIQSAQTYADKVKADAEAQVQQILSRASISEGPSAPAAPRPPTLEDLVVDSMRRHHNQTSIKIARRLKVPEADVLVALDALMRDGRVVEGTQGRSGVPLFKLT